MSTTRGKVGENMGHYCSELSTGYVKLDVIRTISCRSYVSRIHVYSCSFQLLGLDGSLVFLVSSPFPPSSRPLPLFPPGNLSRLFNS